MNNIFDKIKFDKILSNDTVYGIVWTGSYEGRRCVIKMLVLTSGKTDSKYFTKNKTIPWIHSEFKDKKPMTKDAFKHEADSCKNLAGLGLAPKFYGYWINDQHDIHYGFIVLERLDCSIKQILLERDLKPHENKMVNNLIDKLHKKYGIVHGDMKPSNIGVYLDKNKEIKDCYFFDCQKVKYKKDLSRSEFHRRVERDETVYRQHTIDNRAKAKKANMTKVRHHHH